jgi:hypothetical protein
MKPTHHISSNQRPLRGESRSSRAHQSLPLTDYDFQSNAEVRGGGQTFPNRATHASALRRFRQLSSKFFSGETSREFAAEVVCFLLIAGASAWPVFSIVAALARMLK